MLMASNGQNDDDRVYKPETQQWCDACVAARKPHGFCDYALGGKGIELFTAIAHEEGNISDAVAVRGKGWWKLVSRARRPRPLALDVFAHGREGKVQWQKSQSSKREGERVVFSRIIPGYSPSARYFPEDEWDLEFTVREDGIENVESCVNGDIRRSARSTFNCYKAYPSNWNARVNDGPGQRLLPASPQSPTEKSANPDEATWALVRSHGGASESEVVELFESAARDAPRLQIIRNAAAAAQKDDKKGMMAILQALGKGVGEALFKCGAEVIARVLMTGRW
jgi:hypothetical protein